MSNLFIVMVTLVCLLNVSLLFIWLTTTSWAGSEPTLKNKIKAALQYGKKPY